MDNEDVVRAAPTGAAPTTSESSAMILPNKVRLILETWRYYTVKDLWFSSRLVSPLLTQWRCHSLAQLKFCTDHKYDTDIPNHAWLSQRMCSRKFDTHVYMKHQDNSTTMQILCSFIFQVTTSITLLAHTQKSFSIWSFPHNNKTNFAMHLIWY